MTDEAFYRSLLAVLARRVTAVGDEMAQAVSDLELGRAIREAAALVPDPVIHVSWDDGKGGCGGQYLTNPIDMAANALVEAARELLAIYDGEAV